MSYYPLISIMPKATGIDPDAQAFITAAAITDPTQQAAINQLVVDLKGYNIWTKFKAIYPIVGGVASSHAVNLKTPGTYNLTFTNSWTHSATGMTPSVAYANTALNPSSALTLNNTHLSFYSRTNVSAVQREVSLYQSGDNPALALGTSVGAEISDHYNYNQRISASIASSTGFYIGSRTSSTSHKLYKNNTTLGTNTSANVNILPNGNLFIGASNNTNLGISSYSTKECAFASIGDGLTDTEAANFYTAVQAYQTTLGREMIENQQLELDAGNTNSYPGTGTTWTDLSGNSRNGTLTGGVGYSSLNGGYLTFNGTNQYINVVNTTSVLSNVNKFSLNTWFKLNNAALNNTIFSFGTASNFANDILVGVYGNTFLAQVNNGGDGSATIGFTSTAWTNIQLVYDGTLTGNANRLKIYINGVLQTLTYSYTVPSTTGTTSQCGIGVYSTPGFNSNFLNGNVSVTELYSSALDQTQVTQNFNSIKSRYGL